MLHKLHHILLYLLLSLPLLSEAQQTHEVCPSCPISSIKTAIQQAKAHDKLIIQAATYSEYNIVVDKPLHIMGQENAIVDGKSQGEIFIITADSVYMSGLTINNVQVSHTKDNAAIKTLKADYFTFENLTFNEPFFAILVQKSKHGLIRNNTINGNAQVEHSSGNGIHLWHCKDVEVSNNRITQMRDGIYLEFVDNSKVINNYSKGNIRYGLHFMFSNHDEYLDNTFEDNGAGVAVMFSKFINMRNNVFKLNWGTASYGLLLKEIYDAEIKHNDFDQNSIGINADGSNRVHIEENNFRNNGWALKFIGACYDNKLLRNNFISNSFGISYKGELNGNVFDQNYWSEYAGYDLDRDGIGDVPFRPVKLFSYVVNRTPETIILLRSLFVDIINFSEKVSPIFTPDELKDEHPSMQAIQW